MNVLIIEDDPMVEFIHRNYLEQSGEFQQIYSASSISDGKQLLAEKDIELILLDIHLKDGNGLELLSELRNKKNHIEVILITAANETTAVKEGIHLGVVDYLVKPFSKERFLDSIMLFLKRRKTLQNKILPQKEIDVLINNESHSSHESIERLEKGLSPDTLNHIETTAKNLNSTFTIQELADASNLSHVSVRKYVQYLEDQSILTSKTIYTKVGRPYKVYSVR